MKTVYEGVIVFMKWNLWNALILDELQTSKFHKPQIKTVICQLKQDFSSSQIGLYVIEWHGTNLGTIHKR